MLKKPVVVSAIIAALVTALSLLLWGSGALDDYEYSSWRLRVQELSQPGPATDQIKVILIDQESLQWVAKEQKLGWPWPREFYGAMIEYVLSGGAKAVMVDMIFTEPAITDDDSSLAKFLKRHEEVYLACLMTANSGDFATEVGEPFSGWRSVGDTPIAARQAKSWMLPIEELGAHAKLANVNVEPDPDGVIRRVPIFNQIGEQGAFTLGSAALHEQLQYEKGHWMLNGSSLPTDEQSNLILNYRPREESFDRIRAAALLQSAIQQMMGQEPNLPPDTFKDSYVFIGTSAPGLMDLKMTPIDDIMPGVEVHATLLENLLSLQSMRSTPLAATTLFTLGFSYLAGLLILKTRRLSTGLFATLLVVTLPLLAGYYAYGERWWLPLSPLLLASLLAVIVAKSWNYATEGRQRAAVKTAFQHYLSPAVIERVLENPEKLDLGGELRELTIFFSDLAKFSTISERMDARELTTLLNDYLSEMTDIILEEGGTLDKYEGDAIIAFWNAPIDQPDHAERGVRAAIRCQKRLLELKEHYKAMAGQELHMRIGMHSGKVVVGNMGSRKRFDYSMLGDAANLAARLEGANKFFGTKTMISEATVKQLGSGFHFREIGAITVVGRKTPVTVYLPCESDEAEAWKDALSYWRDGQLEKASDALKVYSLHDALTDFYLEDITERLKTGEKPGDGIWNMTSK